MKLITKRSFTLIFIIFMMLLLTTGCIGQKDANFIPSDNFTEQGKTQGEENSLKKTALSFKELSDLKNLEELLAFVKSQFNDEVSSLSKGKIADNELVWLIVKVGDESLVSEFLKQGIYDTVADFVLSPIGKSKVKSMEYMQSAVQTRLKNTLNAEEIKHSYTTLFNGFSVKLPYYQIKALKGIEGVKGVYLSEQYEIPEVEKLDSIFEADGILTNDTGFYGEGMIVGVIDTGINYNHEVFSTPLFNVAYTERQVNDLINQKGLGGKYYNSKIAYGYDYADSDDEVYPKDDHGTHTAGIVAGESNTFSGVAPKAQLAIMKVFSDETNGAYTTDIIKALGDCVLLGVDAINLSLGTPVGLSEETEEGTDYIQKMYKLLDSLGIIVCCSAGNTYNGGFQSSYGGTLAKNPDNGVVSSPGSYKPNLSVASINVEKSYYLLANNALRFDFNNAVDNDSMPYDFLKSFIDLYGEGSFEYVLIPGIGEETDYEGIDVNGKIALIARGNITFEEKQHIAFQKGAIATIIYNNTSGAINMQIPSLDIPSISVTEKVGENLKSVENGHILVSYDNTYGKLISEFSSWGPIGDLSIKPEITAPGGGVLSASFDGYSQMSGTSMSSPNIAGLVVVLKQHLLLKNPEYTNTQIKTIINQLLMSTTTIIKDEFENPVLVRKQGSGLADISSALASPAYLTVTGSDKTKLELGDDPNQLGVYSLNFNLVNKSNKALRYFVNPLTMTEKLSENGTFSGFAKMLNETSFALYVNGLLVEGQMVEVAPGETSKVKVVLSLSENEKNELKENFENGIYVEGFVQLESLNEDDIDLSIPWLTFFGDWTKATIFDATIYDDFDPVQWAIMPLAIYEQDYLLPIGSYVFNLPEGYEAIEAHEKYAAVSIFVETTSSFYSVFFGLLREVSSINYAFTDANTNELLFEYVGGPVSKSYYNTSSQQVYYGGHIVDFNTLTNHLYNNCEILLTITAEFEYEGRIKEETISFKYTIDYEQPKMLNSYVYEENDKTYLELEVYDNQYLQAIQLMSTNKEYTEWVPLDMPFPAHNFKKGYANTITIDLTPYLDNINNQSLGLYLYDFAMNPMAYEIDYSPEQSNLPVPNLPIKDNDFEIDPENQLIRYIGTDSEIIVPSRVTKVSDNAFCGTSVEKVWFENGSMLLELNDMSFANSNVTHAYFHNTPLNIINNNAFTQCNNLVEVYLPKSLTYLGDDVFMGCQNLAYLNLEDTAITELPNHLLFDNDSLTSIIVPSTVQTVRNSFCECRALTSITMLSTIPPMMEGEFIEGEPNPYLIIYVPFESLEAYLNAEGWRNLVDRGITIMNVNDTYEMPDMHNYNDRYIINDGLTFILNYQKEGIKTYNIEDFNISETGVLLSYSGPGGDIIIPASVTSINQNAFYENKNITSVKIQEGCISIGRQAFKGCTNLHTVNLPTTITSLNTHTFALCPALKNINLENTSLVIIASVFESNPSLTEIRFPKTLETLSYAFAECPALKTVYFYSTKVTQNVSGFMRNTNPTKFYVPYGYKEGYKLAWPTYAHLITEMDPVIPEGMLIENGVLLGYEGLETDIVIPIVVTSIAENALKDKNLTSVIFESRDLVSIGANAFANNNIIEIDLTSTKVATIGAGAFSNCPELKRVILPVKTLESLGEFAFLNCHTLTDINLFNAKITIYEQGILANTSLTRVVIPKTVQVIKEEALASSSLTKVVVESSYPCQLADDAFGTADIEIYVPTGLVPLYQSQVGWCNYASMIKEVNENDEFVIEGNTLISYNGTNKIVVIPQNITVIANQAFMNNPFIEEVIFPDSLTFIGNEAFLGCSSLRVVNMISSLVVDIGSKAFYNCEKIESIKLPNTVYFIGTYAFYGCASLLDINLHNTNVATLSYGLMQGCTSLPTITIPASVMTLESYSLYLSTYTTYSMVFLSKVPPVVHNNAFNNNPMSLTFRIYVSPGYSEAYINASGWGYFRNQLLEREEFIVVDGVLIEYLGSGGIVDLPSTITSIGEEVFKDNLEVTSVSIPSSVKYIGERAFMNATNLTRLELRGKTPPQMGIDSLTGTSLRQISIPLGTLDTYIAEMNEYEHLFVELETFHIVNGILIAYYGDDEVVIIPDDVKSVSSTAFNDNTILKEIFFPVGFNRIEDNAFIGCVNLVTLHLPDALTYIGVNAFFGCISLDSIVLGENVNFIGKQAFAYSGLKIVDLKATSLTLIEEKTFEYCRALVEVLLPSTIITINQNAFYQCNSLEKVNFEETSLTTINSYAFYENNLSVINFPNTLTRIESYAFMYNKGLYEIRFSDSLTYIGTLAFHYCSFIKELDLSNTKLVEIGSEAFSELWRLKKVIFPNTLITINDHAFLSCLNLEAIEIPSSVNRIGFMAFAQIPNLTYISISSSINILDQQAFHSDGGVMDRPRIVRITGRKQLNIDPFLDAIFHYHAELDTSTYIVVDDDLVDYYQSKLMDTNQLKVIGVSEMYTITNGVLTSYYGPTKYVVIPTGVTTIGEGVFENYTDMISLTLSSSVQVIDDNAFKGCTSLQKVNLGRDLQYIGNNSFENCYRLSDVRIENKEPIAIGKNVFRNTDPDMVIFVPKNTSSLYQNAWGWKTYDHQILDMSDFLVIGNVLVEYNGNPTGTVIVPEGVYEIDEEVFYSYLIKGIVLPEGLTTINSRAFILCSKLESIILPSTLRYIDYAAFTLCSSLVEITLNEGLVYIGDSAFSSCNSLLSIVIPSTVTYLGHNAFSDLEKLTTIIVNANLDEVRGTIFGATFGKLPALTSVVFNGDIGDIYGIQFYKCDNLTSVTFNGKVDLIRYASFTSLPSLEELSFYGDVGAIVEYAFNDNPVLSKVLFGGSIGNIDFMAFGHCPNLKGWEITEDNNALTIIDNILYDKEVTRIYRQPGAQTLFDTYVVPETVKTIDPYAFSYSKDYAYIGSAFYESLWFAVKATTSVQNYKFKEILITGNIETIGEFAFSYHHNLQRVEFASSITSVVEFEPYAFYGCNNLNTVIMPKRLGDFDISSVFGACPQLKNLIFAEGNDKYIIIDEVIYSADMTTLVKFLNENITEYVVPEGVIKISASAFINTQTLTKITLPSTLLVIGDMAFYGCSNLTTYIFLGHKAPILETYIDQTYDYYYANFIAYIETLTTELTLYCYDNSELYDSYIYTLYFKNILSLHE